MYRHIADPSLCLGTSETKHKSVYPEIKRDIVLTRDKFEWKSRVGTGGGGYTLRICVEKNELISVPGASCDILCPSCTAPPILFHVSTPSLLSILLMLTNVSLTGLDLRELAQEINKKYRQQEDTKDAKGESINLRKN